MRKRLPLFILSLCAACLLLQACHSKGFRVEGTLENGADKTINISEVTPRDGEKDIATITLDKHGHFSFRHDMDYQTFYNLHVNATDYVVLLPQQGEHIILSGDYNNLTHSYEVKGSPESALLWQLQDYSNQGSEALVNLVAQNKQNKATLTDEEYQTAKRETDSIFLGIYSQQAKYMHDFIYDNQGSLATLIALYKPFNNHPLLPPQSSEELYAIVLQGLQEQHPDNPHTINFKNTVEEVRYKYGSQGNDISLSMDQTK